MLADGEGKGQKEKMVAKVHHFKVFQGLSVRQHLELTIATFLRQMSSPVHIHPMENVLLLAVIPEVGNCNKIVQS